MSPAGLNKRVDIWRITFNSDDAVGGAQPTGTIKYYNVQASISPNPVSQLLLQQGLETQKTFTAIVIPGTMDIQERDEFEIVAPRDDLFYGDRFRILGVQVPRLNPRDPRNYIVLQAVRSVIAHADQ